MSKTWIVATLACAIALTACDGRTKIASVSTPASGSPTPVAAAATATPAPVPIPDKPASFSEFAPAIATYLTANAAAAGDNCLADLVTAWKLPLLTPANACIAANTDEDPEREVVAVLTTKLQTPTVSTDTQFEIVVFDPMPGGFKVAYESDPSDVVPAGTTLPIAPLLATGDLNNDGGGEFAYVTGSCGASTCFATVHIFKGTAAGYVTLTPPDGITMPYADAKFEDTDSDGTKELVLHGGAQGSVGSGPQRTRTETWGWNGAVYALRSTQLDKAAYLYHAVKDADTLFAAAKYAEAEAAYVAVVGDQSLKVWSEEKHERNELEAYSLFRAGLAHLLAGGDATKANGYFDRAKSYHPQTLHDQIAGSFKAGYNAKGSVGIGCAAVRDDIAANLAEYQAFWDFGYGNPPFDADAICPF